ncbi:MAG: type III-B CRISPR module RAMP protein Cmr6 [Myxococcota bacterium]
MGSATAFPCTLSLRRWLERLPGAAHALPPESQRPDEQPQNWHEPWDGTTYQKVPVEVLPEPLPAHVGLWLDRCLQENPDDTSKDNPGRAALYRAAVEALRPNTPAHKAYAPAYRRWQRVARDNDASVVRSVLELKSRSRILLHSATQSSVTEGSLLLHHTYGVPYLPGTALKGVCRARARRLHRLLPERYQMLLGREVASLASRGREQEPGWLTELFGYVETGEEGGLGGLIDFWDALWVPEGNLSPLALDIVNPHHSQYYTERHPAPLPNEEPIPTQFLSIAPETRFLLVLEMPALPGAQDWLRFVLEELLLPALELDGIGAKTSSGYGRLEPVQRASAFWGPDGVLGKKTAKPGEHKTLPARGGFEPGMLTRNKGDGSLRATFASGLMAEVRGAAAKALFEGLSPDVKLKLDKNKPQRLLIRWSPVGNARQIDDIKEP